MKKKINALSFDKVVIMLVPITIGGVLAFLTNKTELTMGAEVGHNLIETMTGVLGTMLGFVITAISILLTLGNNKFIELLVASGHMQNIILSYVMASVWLLAALVYSIIILFIQGWSKLIFVTFVGVNVIVAASMIICIFFLFMIVLQMHRCKTVDK